MSPILKGVSQFFFVSLKAKFIIFIQSFNFHLLTGYLQSQPDRSVQGPPGAPGPEGPRGPAGENGRDGRDVSTAIISQMVTVLFLPE